MAFSVLFIYSQRRQMTADTTHHICRFQEIPRISSAQDNVIYKKSYNQTKVVLAKNECDARAVFLKAKGKAWVLPGLWAIWRWHHKKLLQIQICGFCTKRRYTHNFSLPLLTYLQRRKKRSAALRIDGKADYNSDKNLG